MPADHLDVVLTNSDAPPRSPEVTAVRIAAEVIGAWVHDPSAIAVPVEVLDTYVGRYQIAPDMCEPSRGRGRACRRSETVGEVWTHFDWSERVLL